MESSVRFFIIIQRFNFNFQVQVSTKSRPSTSLQTKIFLNVIKVYITFLFYTKIILKLGLKKKKRKIFFL